MANSADITVSEYQAGVGFSLVLRLTAEDARELLAGLEAALDHVHAISLDRDATRITAPAGIREAAKTPARTYVDMQTVPCR